MNTTKEPAFVAETLAWCNSHRVKQGKKPLKRLPKGKIHEADSCPCGKATGLWVYVIDYSQQPFYAPRDLRATKPLPESVKKFVKAFDAGLLPRYIQI
jgi:hypothetical protein